MNLLILKKAYKEALEMISSNSCNGHFKIVLSEFTLQEFEEICKRINQASHILELSMDLNFNSDENSKKLKAIGNVLKDNRHLTMLHFVHRDVTDILLMLNEARSYTYRELVFELLDQLQNTVINTLTFDVNAGNNFKLTDTFKPFPNITTIKIINISPFTNHNLKYFLNVITNSNITTLILNSIVLESYSLKVLADFLKIKPMQKIEIINADISLAPGLLMQLPPSSLTTQTEWEKEAYGNPADEKEKHEIKEGIERELLKSQEPESDFYINMKEVLNCPALTDFTLINSPLDLHRVLDLSILLKNNRSIQRLSIGECIPSSDVIGVSSGTSNANNNIKMASIYVKSIQISNEVNQHISDNLTRFIKNNDALVHLNLSGLTLCEKVLDVLSHKNNLISLNLTNTTIISATPGLQIANILLNNKTLTVLDLSNVKYKNFVEDDIIRILEAIEMMSSNINSSNINSSNVYIEQPSNKHPNFGTALHTLNLRGNKLNSKAVPYLISIIQSNSSIKRLDLSDNDLSDDALTLLVALFETKTKLTHLSLRGNGLFLNPVSTARLTTQKQNLENQNNKENAEVQSIQNDSEGKASAEQKKQSDQAEIDVFVGPTQKLMLSHLDTNEKSDAKLKKLIQLLQSPSQLNSSLQYLDLTNNHFSFISACQLFEGLKSNITIKTLLLEGISQDSQDYKSIELVSAVLGRSKSYWSNKILPIRAFSFSSKPRCLFNDDLNFVPSYETAFIFSEFCLSVSIPRQIVTIMMGYFYEGSVGAIVPDLVNFTYNDLLLKNPKLIEQPLVEENKNNAEKVETKKKAEAVENKNDSEKKKIGETNQKEQELISKMISLHNTYLENRGQKQNNKPMSVNDLSTPITSSIFFEPPSQPLLLGYTPDDTSDLPPLEEVLDERSLNTAPQQNSHH